MSVPTMHAIALDVASRRRVTLDELRGPGTARRVSRPRQEAMAAMSATGLWSRGQIGRFFGRTCWTVQHAEAAEAGRAGASA